MSKEVEQKVVEMRFDNGQFESNVKTSMSTIDKLKQKLNFDGAPKGLEKIDEASRKINMSGLSGAVETVRSRFSALEVVGITTLANITNSAVNAGKRIISALTIDPIKAGFQEYETQINAVQTILANTESKGATLQNVNAALAELNVYADKTIYNFTEMTRNIGTFTAAGVGLSESVQAIKGIANLAAVSGSTSQQASTAMYQLSQALASGTVKLMDWNSVVNAGMGGQVFQESLKETARVHNIAIDDMIKSEGSFRETLQKGWLTSEILTETLSKFTGDLSEAQLKSMGYTDEQIKGIMKLGQTANDAATKVKTFTQLFDTLKEAAQSGWTKTWEIIVGDFGEAKETLTKMSDTFGKMLGDTADARNKLLGEGLSSGWKQLLNAGIADEAGYIDAIQAAAKKNGDAFEKMVNDSETFTDALKKGLKEGVINSGTLTEAVGTLQGKMSKMSAEELKNAGYTSDMVVQIEALKSGLDNGSISMDKFINKIQRTSGRENLIQALWNSLDAVLSIINPIKEAFKEIFPPATGEQLYNLTERIRDFTSKLKLSDEQSANLKATFRGFFSIISIGVTWIKDLGRGLSKLVSHFSGCGDGILGITASIGKWFEKLRVMNEENNLFARGVEKIVDVLGKVIDKIKDFGSAVKTKFESPGFNGFYGLLKGIWDVIIKIGKKVSEVCSKIGQSIGSAFRNGDMTTALDLVNGGLLASLLIGIKKFMKGFGDSIKDVVKLSDQIKGILDSVRGCLEAYQKNIKANVLLKIAIAIGILTASILTISTIKPERLAQSLGAVTVLFGQLLGSLALFNKISGTSSKTSNAIGAMIGMAVAVRILASSMKALGTMRAEDLTKGTMAITILLGEILGFTKLMGKTKMLKSTATAMVIMASAMKIFASAVKALGSLSVKQLVKGVGALGLVLLEIVGFTKLMGKSKVLVSTATAMVIMASAMKIFASAIGDLGGLDVVGLAKGLGAIGFIFLEIASFKKLMGNSKGMVSTAVALTVMATAMKVFASVIGDIGAMDIGTLSKGLIGLAVSLTILGVAMFAMKKSIAGSAALLVASTALIALSIALKIIASMSVEELIKSLIGLAGAFVILGIAGAVLGPLVPAILGLGAALVLIGVGILSVGVGILALSAAFAALATIGVVGATAVVASLAIIINGIAALIPAICIKVAEGIIAICRVIIDSLPVLVQLLVTIITGICDAIIQTAPKITEAIIVIVTCVCQVLMNCVPMIVQTGFALFIAFLKSMSDNIGQIVELGMQIIINFINGISKKLPDLIQAAFNLVISFINGLADAIRKNHNRIYDAAWNLITALVDAMIDIPKFLGEKFIKVGKNIIDGLGSGIKKTIGKVKDIAKDIGNSLLNGVKGILGIHSPSKAFEEVGVFADEGLINGLKKFAGRVYDAGTDLGSTALDAVKSTIAKISDAVDSDIDSQPTIRPVLDLSNITSGARSINSLFSNDQAIAIAADGGPTSKLSGGGPNVTMTIYGAPGQDVNQLADIVSEKINNSIKRGTNVWR